MDLTIFNTETSEELDKCSVTDWLKAVQYVEKNRQTYLDAGCTIISVGCSEGFCKWDLTEEKRPSFLEDFIHPNTVNEITEKRKRKKKKDLTSS